MTPWQQLGRQIARAAAAQQYHAEMQEAMVRTLVRLAVVDMLAGLEPQP